MTVDGVTHRRAKAVHRDRYPEPDEQAGTHRLPEAQLDRFLMKSRLRHYPDAEATEELLLNSGLRDRVSLVEPIMKIELVSEMSRIADEVHVDGATVTYVRKLAEVSRDMEQLRLGSPREDAWP